MNSNSRCPTSPNSKQRLGCTFPRRKSCCASRSRIRPSRTKAAWRRAAQPAAGISRRRGAAARCCRSSFMKNFPTSDEGPLTKSRAKLVNRNTLAEHGRALGPRRAFDFEPRRGKRTAGANAPSALADAFEALLGAIFLDGGFDAAREFILREFAGDFAALAHVCRASKIRRANCRNCCRRVRRPRRNIKSFPPPGRTMTAILSAPCCTTARNWRAARGKSKKAAESDAALAALKKLRETEGASAKSEAPNTPKTRTPIRNPNWFFRRSGKVRVTPRANLLIRISSFGFLKPNSEVGGARPPPGVAGRAPRPASLRANVCKSP